MATALVAHSESRNDKLKWPAGGGKAETRVCHGFDLAQASGADGLRCRGKESKVWSLRHEGVK